MIKKITRKKMRNFLSKYKTDKKVLDIGSGGSSYGDFFPNRLCVDIDVSRGPDIVADAHNLPFEDNEFEFVLSTEMLEHVQDPFQVEKEMRRVLAPGGTLVLSTRFIFPLHDTPNDYWRFTKYGLKELFKEWDILEIQPETENFTTLGVLLQRMCYQSNFKLNKLTKACLFFVAWVLSHFDWLIKEEFGDIKKSCLEKGLMPSGYYLVCKKR